MFDPFASAALGDATLGAPAVEEWVAMLASAPCPDGVDAQLDLIAMLERLKSAAEGLQAEATVRVDVSMRRRAAERGVAAARQGLGVAARSRSPDECRPTAGNSWWGWRRRCTPSFRARGRRCATGGSASGARRSWRARRPASPAPTG